MGSYFLVEYFDYNQIQQVVNLVVSFTPFFSYGITSYQIYLRKTTSGFSIDVCLMMLISSIFKILYYFMAPFEISLLRQAVVMIIIQIILLKVALKYMESPIKLYENDLNVNLSNFGLKGLFMNAIKLFDNQYKRPFKLWQWFDDDLKFWEFLLVFTNVAALVSILGFHNQHFISLMGVSGLFTEALLPLPQILLNYRRKTAKNFKSVLLLTWLCGDATKIGYLLFGTNHVSALFMWAALFQLSLDLFILFQYFYYKRLDEQLSEKLPGP